jgi:diguanylate cyclase (GGDEF)-like protein/PAS domain S-box-containing protein
MSKIDPDASGQPNPAQAVNREGEAALSLFSLPDLFDTLPEAVVVADRTRRVVYLNAAAEALFGYSLRDLRGRTTDVFYADHADFLTLGKEHYNGKTNPSFSPYRVSYRCSDGSRFLGQTSARGLTNAQGEIQGYLAMVRPARSAEQSVDTLQRLHSITADAELDHDAKLVATLELGVRHFGLDLAILSSIKGEEYRVEHCRDPAGALSPGATFDLGSTYCVHALNAGGPVGFHHAGESEIRTHPCYRDFGLEAYVGCPILVNGTLRGTLNFSSAQACSPFSRDDLVFMQLLADTVGYEIHQNAMRNQLSLLARTDELTGLANRRAVMESLRWQMSHSLRSDLPLTVMSLDLDHFKAINDTWGHGAGDHVLRGFSELLGSVTREVDLCGRLGGEEFIVVLPDTDTSGGCVVGDRLRRRLAETPMPVSESESINVTVSAGLTSLQPGDTLESILQRVDHALYQAKQSGRDRLCIARE